MKANERLSKVVGHTGESRASLARRADLIPQRLTDIINEKTKDISFDVADKLANAVPNLNREWLLTGEGDMLLDESGPQGRELEQEVDPNKGVRYYPNIPITASHIEDMPEPSHDDLQYQLMRIPGFEGCVAYPAVGDSMYPRISNGDVVVFKEWKESYISNGEIYLIITRNGDRTIKYLTLVRTEDDKKYYQCRSANPDQDRFAPFEIDGDEIVRLYIVYGCVKKFKM